MAIKAFELYGDVLLKGSDKVNKDLDSIDSKGAKVGSTFGTKLADGAKVAAKAVAAMAVAAGVAIGKLAKDSLGAAMDLEATQAKFSTVFGEYEEQMSDTIKKFQELTPATTAAARSMASGIQDLLVPMGFAREEATKMTTETMHLVGALTNFNSATHSAEDVANAFSAALTGETEPLKRLGIQVSKEIIQQKALAMGLAATKDEITKAHEAQALLSLAYEQSGDALAAYNEESLDAKTKTELMKASFTDLQAELGGALIPVQMEFIDLIRDNMPLIKETMTRTFDAIIPLLQSLAKNVLPAVMELLPVFASLFEAIAPAIDALLPLFTQLITDLLPPLIELFSGILETILPPLVDILGSLFKALTPILDVIMDIVADTVLPILNTLFDALTPLLKAVFDVLGPLFDALKPVFDVFSELTKAIMPILNLLFEALKPLIDALAPAFNALGLVLAIVADTLRIIIASVKWLIDNIGFLLGMNEYQDFGFDFGNTATEAAIRNISGRAFGGEIGASGFYRVGEEGPEIVSLPVGAYVHDADETAAMGNNLVMNIYNNNNPSPYDVYRLAQKNSQIAWQGI